MRIDAVAGERHYAEHITPILEALPAELQGELYTRIPPHSRNPIIIASLADHVRARAGGRAQIIATEHGAGQSYSSKIGNYPGGAGREGTALFLAPNEYAAARWRDAYPTTPVRVIGYPKLDRAPSRAATARPPEIAVSFHFNAMVGSPEARSALKHFRPAIAELPRRFNVIGHGHPRSLHELEPEYRSAGIEVVRDFSEVLERASVYVCDNSSTILEAAAFMPVVLMNAPWYRRSADHGGRFWDWAPVGFQVDEPELLPLAIYDALNEQPAQSSRRREIVAEALGPLDGQAGRRAAAAILEALDLAPVSRETAAAA